MDTQFTKRFKSFLWRGGMVAIIAFIDYVLANIGILNLPVWAVGLIGLIGGEITKWFNSYQNLKGKTFFGREIIK